MHKLRCSLIISDFLGLIKRKTAVSYIKIDMNMGRHNLKIIAPHMKYLFTGRGDPD